MNECAGQCLPFQVAGGEAQVAPSERRVPEAPDARRELAGLEEENAELKKMFADVSLENHAIKELFAKKIW